MKIVKMALIDKGESGNSTRQGLRHCKGEYKARWWNVEDMLRGGAATLVYASRSFQNSSQLPRLFITTIQV